MTGVTLEALFKFQDDAAIHNTAKSVACRNLLEFVREAVGVLADVFDSMHFADHKQHTIRVLGADALTGIVTSVRVGLWGNLPEAAALLRSSLETTSILAAAVEGDQYVSIATELSAAKLKRYSYDRSVAKLGEVGRRIEYLRGRLSDLGAHSTGTRLKFASYRLDGDHFDRVGAALDPEATELALSMAPDVCLHLLETLERAFAQDRSEFAQSPRLEALREAFGNIKDQPGAA
jgi:hypothetical protein